MRKNLLLIVISILAISTTFAQDRIAKMDRTILDCKIISIDSSVIKFRYYYKGSNINSFIDKKDVLFYVFNGEITYIYKKDPDSLPKDVALADSIENLHKNFIYKYSGEIIFGNNIEYETPFLGLPRFIVDSKRLDADNVHFYKNEQGFFANTKNFNFSGISTFSQRVRKGKINLYEREVTHYSPGQFNQATHMYSGGTSYKSIKNYYNIGFGELKKANYKNLSVDLADNPESMIYLKKYKSINHTQALLYVAGSGALITGIAMLVKKTEDADKDPNHPKPNLTGSVVTVCLGAGCFWASYFITFAKPKQLRKAIDAYNK